MAIETVYDGRALEGVKNLFNKVSCQHPDCSFSPEAMTEILVAKIKKEDWDAQLRPLQEWRDEISGRAEDHERKHPDHHIVLTYSDRAFGE